MLTAHREETVLSEEGTLFLKNLPFHVGDAVEVIILPRVATTPNPMSDRLRGSVVAFVEPLAPAVEPSDWIASA
jgi:hypothetical protein